MKAATYNRFATKQQAEQSTKKQLTEKIAVIYARYSCEKQTEQSIEGQLRICYDYAERNGITIVGTYIDRATTGTNDKREQFQQMLKDSANGIWTMVLVYKLDRFSRNKYETAMNKKTLRDNGVKLVSAMENIPDTPEGIILESLLEGMAEYYSAELSQKVLRGLNENRQKGLYTGGALIFGYRAENKKVYVYEPEAEIIRRIFDEAAAGKQMKEILEELNEQGVLYKGKPFAKSTAYRLLANEKYIGIYRHGEEVFTNIYPRIVSDSVFYFVKEKLEGNKYGKHKKDVVYLLKDKIKCGYCGHSVISDSGTSKNGSVMRYYKCNGKKTYHNCPATPIRKELIEQIIVDTTYDVLTTPETIDRVSTLVLEAHQKRVDDNSLIDILQSEYTQTHRSIENILNNMEKGIVTQSMRERLEQLEIRKGELYEKLAIEKAKYRKPLTKNDIVTYLKTAVKKQARQMIKILVKEVRLFNDKVEIHYNYTEKTTSPDNDEDYQDFSFYKFEKTFLIDQRKIGVEPIRLKLKIELYI